MAAVSATKGGTTSWIKTQAQACVKSVVDTVPVIFHDLKRTFTHKNAKENLLSGAETGLLVGAGATCAVLNPIGTVGALAGTGGSYGIVKLIESRENMKGKVVIILVSGGALLVGGKAALVGCAAGVVLGPLAHKFVGQKGSQRIAAFVSGALAGLSSTYGGIAGALSSPLASVAGLKIVKWIGGVCGVHPEIHDPFEKSQVVVALASATAPLGVPALIAAPAVGAVVSALRATLPEESSNASSSSSKGDSGKDIKED